MNEKQKSIEWKLWLGYLASLGFEGKYSRHDDDDADRMWEINNMMEKAIANCGDSFLEALYDDSLILNPRAANPNRAEMYRKAIYTLYAIKEGSRENPVPSEELEREKILSDLQFRKR